MIDGPTIGAAAVAVGLTALAARCIGLIMPRFGQPPVVGEIVAGILLGPTCLGAVAPDWQAWLFPKSVLPIVDALGQAGIVLYMFLIGWELDLGHLRDRVGSVFAIALGGMAPPFVAGVVGSVYLFGRFSPADPRWLPFALFFGAALSVTAFPVLARILHDRGWADTDLGRLSLGSAALADVAAWCLVAIAAGSARSQWGDTATMLVASVGFIGAIMLAVGPALRRWLRSRAGSWSVYPAIVAALLAGTGVSEWIGLHAVFGAFLIGLVLPHESPLLHSANQVAAPPLRWQLLPAFFASVGLRTRIGLIDELAEWLIAFAIIAVAVLTKLGGTYVMARLMGIPARPAFALGALMNTRGLMELIVLNIGRQLGVLDATLFAIMVVMTIVTTALTGPLLAWVDRPSLRSITDLYDEPDEGVVESNGDRHRAHELSR